MSQPSLRIALVHVAGDGASRALLLRPAQRHGQSVGHHGHGQSSSVVARHPGAPVSRPFGPAFIVLGYITAWMMWVPGNERRVLFFYHALGMLIFAALALAYVLAAIRRAAFQPNGGRRISLAPISYALVGSVV